MSNLPRADAVTLTADPPSYEAKRRTEWLNGMAAVLDWMTDHPELPNNPSLTFSPLSDEFGPAVVFFLHEYEWDEKTVAERMALIVRALKDGAPVSKRATETAMIAYRRFGPITVAAYADRTAVCERVVVGQTTEMVKTVTAPAVIALRPQTVDVVEWRCNPILGLDEAAS